MKEDYIEVSIDSPSPIDFSNGDYIIYDYNGIKYTLSDPIGVKKQARKDTYSKAFVYTGIKFNSNFNLLFRCMFLDIVQEDNLNHYTSLPDVDTFEDVYGIAGRIQANLDNQYPNTFNIKIVDTTGNAELESILRTARAFSVSNGYCSDALSTIYDQWGVGYIYTVENGKDTIIIGGTAGESTVFRYGKNNGLRVITSDIQNLSELCNRIYPFGSTRNLPARWYNKKQYIQDLQYAPNLLIPKSKWGDNNPRSAFVENAESINKYGLRPKAIYWDGSDSDRIEICPSIEGVTAGVIRQAKAEAKDTTYIPSTELYPDDELVDEILVGDNIEDDGLNIDTGYKLYSEQYAYAYNAEKGKDFQTNKIGTIGKDGAELGFAFTFEMPNKLTPFTLPKDAVYRIGSPDHELVGYNTLPYLYIPRTYAKSYATYLFSQNHPAYLVGRAEGTNDFWRWECSIEESDEGFTIRPIAEQTISLRAGSSLFFSFEVSASILFSDSYAIEHLNEEIFATCYIRGGGFYIQRGLNYIFQDFNIYIKQIGFNIADYPSEDNNYITININTGSCAGRSFKIRKVEYDSALDRWKLNCYRSDDNTLSLRFPNSDFHISAGDKFVITNIQMPDLYVYMAMERLYNEALKELDLLSNPSRIYTPEIDNLQMARSPQVLRAGMFMPISDDDLNIQSDNAILIDSIEISEGENPIRTFSITLRNEKQDNILKKNKRGIKSISVALKKSKSEASRVSSNESVNQDSTGVTSGGTSVSSYDNLTNKPSINDVELKGNLTSEDLGLQPKGEYVNKDDFNKHTNNKDIHISSEEREKWNNKSDLTAEDVKGIKVNNAAHADSADNATKAGSADKLTNSHKIFGLPFDGTKDVDGGITANGDSVINGNLNVTKDGIFGGEVSGIVGEGTPAGVTDYSALTGKPSINGKELVSGNNTLASLGIQAAGDYATNSGVATLLADYATKTFVSNNYVGKTAFNNHTGNTNIHITSAERDAWNAKWDYNEATIKAIKVTSASSADSVAWTGISNKPSTFTPSAHTHTASEVSGLPTSLKNPYALTFGSKSYDGSAAATITASDLGALTAHQTIYALTLKVNGTSQGVYNPASAVKTINIAVPTKTSQITNDSGFITSASIPTALKNPYAVEIKANGVSLGTYDGSEAATFNLSAANVGAANKVHSHTASEISGLPTKLSAFTNDVGYITGITKSMVEGVLTGDITSHTHSYLPLSGGTMMGPIKFNDNSLPQKTLSYVCGIDAFANGGEMGWMRGSDFVAQYAPTLTGTGASGTWGINISGNASSASKLQTPRTIWGQSFDGSANVRGGIDVDGYKNVNSITKVADLGTIGLVINATSIRKNWGMCFWTESNGRGMIQQQAFTSAATTYPICLQPFGGNVGIGTGTPQYKLDVNGRGHYSGDLIVDGEVSALVA